MLKTFTTIILLFAFIAPSYGKQDYLQEGKKAKDSNTQSVRYGTKEGELFVTASMTGASVGFKYRKPIINEVTLLVFDIQISSARGEKEAVYIDPYYGYPIKTGREYVTFFMPFHIGIQRRVFKDDIEANFRPFVIAELGPVFGVSFPTKYNFGTNLKKGRGMPTLGAYVGLGVEFGSEEDSSSYAFGAGYRILSFFEKLGEKKDYSSFTLKIGWVVRW